MCDKQEKEIDKLTVMCRRQLAALQSMKETMHKANNDLRAAYDKLPMGPCFAIPSIGMDIEAGMARAADILEGKVKHD